MSQQLTIRLPDRLADRLNRAIPARDHSRYIADLLEQALPPEKMGVDQLYEAAVAVEHDQALGAEMAEWEQATIPDGLPKTRQPDR